MYLREHSLGYLSDSIAGLPQAVANSRSNSALHYLWLDVTRQRSFWEGMGLGSGDAPTAVAISLKRRRQAQLDPGQFTEAGLRAFVDKLVQGKAITNPLQVFLITSSIPPVPTLGLCIQQSLEFYPPTLCVPRV